MPPRGASSQEMSCWIGRGKVVEISTRNAREKVIPVESAQENKSESSRDAILEAAFMLISKQGYRRTSARAIAAEAGMSLGNVYGHFPSMDVLLRSLLDRYGEVPGGPEPLVGMSLVETPPRTPTFWPCTWESPSSITGMEAVGTTAPCSGPPRVGGLSPSG
jgi:hypothetical protein